MRLLDREHELETLRDLLRDARSGRGRLAVVEAAGGLGKTSLLGATADAAARSGFTTLRARASELERGFAYGCIRQLLDPLVARASSEERDRLFDGAAALARPLLVAPGGPDVDGPSTMLHGLYWMLNNVADAGPVLLMIDDLHVADVESLRFLAYLAPRLDGLPLAVAVTARPGESGGGELTLLVGAPETVVLRPGPLGPAATAELCEHWLGTPVTPAFAEACRHATDGNAFYLDALLREMRDQDMPAEADRVRGLGPAAVAQAVLLRLSGQPPAVTALVRAVTVLGDGASIPEAAALAGISEDEAVAAADLLAARAILQPGRTLAFAHPIVRDAVYADTGAHQRAREHARAAALLAAAGAADERVAAQILASEPAGDQDRVELLRRVASASLGRGAPRAAIAWLERALAEPPADAVMPELELELGCARLRVGAPGAIAHLQAAAAGLKEPARLATAVRELANALTMSARADEAVAVLEPAVAAVEARDREQALLLDAEIATHALQGGPDARAAAARRLARHAALTGATAGERLVLASLACERARQSTSAAEAAHQLETALAGGQLIHEQSRDIVGTFYDVILGLLATDALELANAALDQALAAARARSSIPATAWLTSRAGWVALRRGDVSRAEDDGRTALALLEDHGIPLGRPFALALLVVALIEAGRTAEAQDTIDRRGFARDIAPGVTTNALLAARGLLHLARGEALDAREDLVAFGARDERWGAANALASRWRSDAALAVLAAGDTEAARTLATDDLGRARRWGAASGIGIALRAAALTRSGEDAITLLGEAVDVLAASPARLEHARALTDHGAALRRANRRAEARSALGEAMVLAGRCGATALEQRARAELQSAGGRWSDPAADGVAQLTASERRVAALAATGRSNPEIAQALFVTRKTVETHLGHVYEKLAISGRGELPRRLAEQAA